MASPHHPFAILPPPPLAYNGYHAMTPYLDPGRANLTTLASSTLDRTLHAEYVTDYAKIELPINAAAGYGGRADYTLDYVKIDMPVHSTSDYAGHLDRHADYESEYVKMETAGTSTTHYVTNMFYQPQTPVSTRSSDSSFVLASESVSRSSSSSSSEAIQCGILSCAPSMLVLSSEDDDDQFMSSKSHHDVQSQSHQDMNSRLHELMSVNPNVGRVFLGSPSEPNESDDDMAFDEYEHEEEDRHEHDFEVPRLNYITPTRNGGSYRLSRDITFQEVRVFDWQSYGEKRPDKPFRFLIAFALLNAPSDRAFALHANDICMVLKEHFPYFAARETWKSSIRHTLSDSVSFMKIRCRQGCRSGNCFEWTFTPEAMTKRVVRVGSSRSDEKTARRHERARKKTQTPRARSGGRGH
ncbi:uncharacterized protein V1518DRAFT_260226 [Limtongia smithiae]|uniref:uncharacterized protein n=1 Tax=Limtongia smithiae TaxID=1125753 RepID=UPI0034CE2E35